MNFLNQIDIKKRKKEKKVMPEVCCINLYSLCSLKQKGKLNRHGNIENNSIYLYTLAVSPSLGGSRQHKEQQKQWGFHSVLLAMTRDPAEKIEFVFLKASKDIASMKIDF